MSFLDALWHLLNFAAPAVLVPLIAALLAKAVWRREMKGVSLRGLWWPASALGLLVSIAGLVAFGHDGKMATYAGLVACTALMLWWRGLR